MEIIIGIILFASSIVSLPNAIYAWKIRKSVPLTASLSVGKCYQMAIGLSITIFLSVRSELYFIAFISTVVLIPILLSCYLIPRYRKIISEEYSCKFCKVGAKHSIFITKAPGWGSVVECTSETVKLGLYIFSDEDIEKFRQQH